jgi:putative endopeptidase
MSTRITIQKSNFDETTRSQDDFFQYANGGWIANNPMPDDQARWGSFYTLGLEQMTRTRDILDDLLKEETIADEEKAKVKAFYKSAMDIEAVNKLGATPILPYIEKIKALTRENAVETLASIHLDGFSPFFRTYIFPDEKIVTQYIPYIFQSGLGMPDRDYYLSEDEKMKAIQEKYRSYMKELLLMSNYAEDRIDQIDQVVTSIYGLEKRLATASMSRTDMREPEKLYHKRTFIELAASLPTFNWEVYFSVIGIPLNQDVIVNQPAFMELVASVLAHDDLQIIKDYMSWQVIRLSAPYLSDAFIDADFAFNKKVIAGVEKIKPRWYRSIIELDGSLGYAVGKLYVEKYFTETAKKKMTELVANITKTLDKRLRKLDWMSEATKENALKKLGTFVTKLGYPDKWKEYNGLVVGDVYFTNVIESSKFDFAFRVSRLGTLVDKSEWEMTPQTVNAYYMASMNEIVFPAGILQAPFFDERSDDALNYGGIGSVIAHEITHGFDDQGSKYDAEGNLAEWWTEDDRKQFMEKAQVLVDQFNAISPLPNMHINGQLTLGENIADLGGVILAYEAYIESLNGKPEPEVVDGLTHTQRFFLRFTEGECGIIRPEMLQNQLLTDPHSPSKYRVNAILPHCDAFYEAFDIKEGDAMYIAPEKRARIW